MGLFLGAGIEGETIVLIGGTMVHHGLLPFWPAAAAAAGGSFIADQLFFLLGRRFRDRPFVQRMQTRPAFVRALRIFERHPAMFVFAFRFLYGLRTVSPIAIGTTQLPARTFLFLNAAAAIVWGTVFVGLGYWFGEAIETAFGRVRDAGLVILPVLGAGGAIALIVYLLHRRYSR
ncbi:DedA family protein [Sphingomonas xinjiangensis]|uniref:Membrane protein DedA with SNARE-associated domain n=1 Tax=Sphingomonas xinjiangensis TaxID=643568 RepID=A0A840YGK7_9SPHN|nr:DedA family protein [Sphingomonas xinjiangensis]MBB5711984.1 membrane protein DedA with SNARE-associated domain [Sphingomonas xinjiangensis]